MATRASTLRQGLGRGRSAREELKSLRRLLARVAVDEITVVRKARAVGFTWRGIGDELGMTESGARRRYQAKGIS